MIQKAFRCSTLSSISRATAIVRRFSSPVGPGRCSSGEPTGKKGSGMRHWKRAGKPPSIATSCSSRRREQVVEPVLAALQVAVEHRRVGEQAQLVGDAVDGQPLVAADLAAPGLAVDAVVEDLGAAAGQRVEPGGLEVLQHRPHAAGEVGPQRPLADAGEVNDLHGREGLQVQAGRDSLEARQQVGVVAEGQLGVQPADDVHLGGTGGLGLNGLLLRLLDGVRVRARLPRLPLELAELAAEHADVGVVQVPVDVVVRLVAVHPPPHAAGEFADAPEVGRLEEDLPVGKPKPLAVVEFSRDVGEPGVVPHGQRR